MPAAPAKPAAPPAPAAPGPSTTSAASEPPRAQGLTLHDVLSLRLPLFWQEAVALTLETINGVPDTARFPASASVIVCPSGEIQRLGGTGLDGSAVNRAASLLRDLLATSHPPAELRTLAERDSSQQPKHASLSAFAQALTYFERPNRRGDVAAVHARANPVLQKSLADQEFERVRAKATHALDGPSEGRRLFGRLRPRSFQNALIASLWGLIGVNGLGLFMLAFGAAPRRPALPVAAAASMPAVASAARDVRPPGPAVSTPRPPPAAADRSRTNSARTAPQRNERRPTSASPQLSPISPGIRVVSPPARSPRSSPPDDWTVTVREVLPTPDPADPRRQENVAPSVDPSAVYSDADADVEPAMLQRPQLPGVIAVGADRASESVLELTISAKGTVERVQLISMENRLSDKMLLAAAKAWQFRPATKDGRPVRYRLRLGVAR
jgi:hypothetical protein